MQTHRKTTTTIHNKMIRKDAKTRKNATPCVWVFFLFGEVGLSVFLRGLEHTKEHLEAYVGIHPLLLAARIVASFFFPC